MKHWWIGLGLFLLVWGYSAKQISAANGCGGNLSCGTVNKLVGVSCDFYGGVCDVDKSGIFTGCDTVSDTECSGTVSDWTCHPPYGCFNSGTDITCCTGDGGGGVSPSPKY